MSIYDPISIALNIEPIDIDYSDISNITPNDTKNSQTFNLESNRANASKGGKARAAKGYPAWNKGKTGFKRSLESIEKQKISITGKKKGSYLNYNYSVSARSIVLNGVFYASIKAARKDTGMAYYTIMKLLHTATQVPEL